MRHRNKTVKLNRESGPRKALLRGLINNVVSFESITTTEGKARAAKPLVEKLITRARKGDLASRREVAKVLYTQKNVKKLMDVIAPRYKDRQGGYTRITKLGYRQGDGALMVALELV